MFSTRALAMLLFFMLSAVITGYGQGTAGSISGTINDQSGAAIAGAAVMVNNQDTGLAREAAADANGNFNVTLLPPGRYTVKVAVEGFKNLALADVVVNITQVTALRLTLEPASVSEVVTVTATAPLVQTES